MARKANRREKGLWALREVERRLLEGIGEPEEKDFVPSPFQVRAVEYLLKGEDVIVVAPTGSGKTWIALRAAEDLLRRGRSVWYTTPLKALSNQKYDDFRGLFGDPQVGLLTGERRENPHAPLIVATTEVLRNLLYRGEGAPDFVVLDEAHYLGDEDRGTTWEEVLILAPPETQFLLLSATISNSQELAGWIASLRGKRPKVVTATERPVPLRYAFLAQEGVLLPLRPEFLRGTKRFPKKAPEAVLEILEEKDLVPVIWFLGRRRDCDRTALRFKGTSWPGRAERLEVFREAVGDDPHLWSHPLLDPLIEGGVASHHAGHLTGWKVAVERMLAKGLLRAVFATTTLAAGLDVPARTVVLNSLSSGNGERLSTLEFQQMTGRAGRRGKDKVGFVVLVSSRRDCLLGLQLSQREPEPLRSSFRLHYYQILNLLDRWEVEEAEDFVEKSFLLYQIPSGKRRRKVRNLLIKHFHRRVGLLKELGYLDEDLTLTPEGKWCLLLRHENSLVFAEVIRRGLYKGLDPATFAAWVGSLSSERAPRKLLGRVDLSPMRKVIREIEALEHKWGIPSMELKELYRSHGQPAEAERRASAVKAWAKGMEWQDLVEGSQMEEGDLQRLILQTSELLREMEDLPLSDVAALAGEARALLMRPPVFY